MKNKLFVGIDNGVTGTVGIIYNNDTYFFKIPVKNEQSYTKAKANISRVDLPALMSKMNEVIWKHKPESAICLIERPMVNPGRFKATVSALRALESTLICVELLKLPHQYEDSRAWQKLLLPSGSAKDQLKKDSKDIGCRLFPQHSEMIMKHGDADGLLLAEYARRKF